MPAPSPLLGGAIHGAIAVLLGTFGVGLAFAGYIAVGILCVFISSALFILWGLIKIRQIKSR